MKMDKNKCPKLKIQKKVLKKTLEDECSYHNTDKTKK